MNGIPATINLRLRDALLKSDVVHNGRQLRAMFADDRLRPWRSGLPQADNADMQVTLLIDYLHNKRHADYRENALVLFVKALSESIDSHDALHQELRATRRHRFAKDRESA